MSDQSGGNQGLCLRGTNEDGLAFGEQLGVVDDVGPSRAVLWSLIAERHTRCIQACVTSAAVLG